ncbi:MAG: PLP-dependent aminotransferase family protein [Rhodospirillales bacterium]|nr:PLP-dependent aminotransferase family protein [Rhodospirillales bacterium]
MTIWTPDISGRSGPKYLAIAGAIAEAIGEGTLAAGEKLPPQRNLAYDIGVTLGTVTRAYDEIKRRGLVDGEVGRGTFVLPRPGKKSEFFFRAKPADNNLIDFTHATPISGRAGKEVARTLADICREADLDALMDYQILSGRPEHLLAAAHWLNQGGIKATPERITLTSGAQHGILITLMALTQPGDTVLAEELSYPGLIHVVRQLGLKLEPVAMDAHGLIPEALEEAARRTGARFLYCIPNIQNPTTRTMPEHRVREIAARARALDLQIMEDDVWGGLSTRESPPLIEFAPERVFHISSLSKTMAGGLRIGYVLSPVEHVEKLRTAVRLSNWMTPPLMAEIARRWIEDGTGLELANWQRQAAGKRLSYAAKALEGQTFAYHPAGHYIWLEMPLHWRAADFKAAAEARGVLVPSSESFVVGRQAAPHAIRIAIGTHNADDGDAAKGLDILADILKSPTSISPSVV